MKKSKEKVYTTLSFVEKKNEESELEKKKKSFMPKESLTGDQETNLVNYLGGATMQE